MSAVLCGNSTCESQGLSPRLCYDKQIDDLTFTGNVGEKCYSWHAKCDGLGTSVTVFTMSDGSTFAASLDGGFLGTSGLTVHNKPNSRLYDLATQVAYQPTNAYAAIEYSATGPIFGWMGPTQYGNVAWNDNDIMIDGTMTVSACYKHTYSGTPGRALCFANYGINGQTMSATVNIQTYYFS